MSAFQVFSEAKILFHCGGVETSFSDFYFYVKDGRDDRTTMRTIRQFMLILSILPFAFARTEDRDRWFEPQRGFTGQEIPDPGNDEAIHWTEAALPDAENLVPTFEEHDEDYEEDYEEEYEEALPSIEQAIALVVEQVPNYSPETCINQNSDFCCKAIFFEVEDAIIAILTRESPYITDPNVELTITWESFIEEELDLIDPRDAFDENDIDFKCRAVIKFLLVVNDIPGTNVDVSGTAEIHKIDHLFNMKCRLPFVRRQMSVLRVHSNELDTIGICVNRKRKRDRLELPGSFVMSDPYRAGSKLSSHELAGASTSTPQGEIACVDMPAVGDFGSPGPQATEQFKYTNLAWMAPRTFESRGIGKHKSPK